MGILNFFKKKEVVKREISFEDIPNWILEKKSEERLKEKETSGRIKPLISDFLKELCVEIEELVKVDITNKKEDEKLKMLVIKNRDEYLKYLDSFIKKLEHIDHKGLEEATKYLKKTLIEFQKESRIHYERATILIGKPMGDTHETIGGFAMHLNKIFQKSAAIYSNLKIINDVEEKFGNIPLVEKERDSIDAKLKESDKKKKELETAIKKVEKDIEDKKTSKEYLEEKANHEKSIIEKKRIENELSSLKSTIDFKSLKNLYHVNDKKMKLIKDYEEDFSLILYRDDIFELLSEKEIEFLKNKIAEVRIKIKEIQKLESQNDSFAPLILDKGSYVASLKNIEKEIEANGREVKKLDEKINELKESILTDVKSYN